MCSLTILELRHQIVEVICFSHLLHYTLHKWLLEESAGVVLWMGGGGGGAGGVQAWKCVKKRSKAVMVFKSVVMQMCLF